MQNAMNLCEKNTFTTTNTLVKKAYNDMLAYADEKFKKEYAEWVRSNNPGKIECPVCHTISGKKISVGAKAVSVGLFGIFSQKVKKTWHCEICGYEW